jgi:hypothetical protein
MKKVKKIVLRTVLIVILLICVASWYLNNIFLPQKLKVWVVDFLSTRTARQVTLDRINYNIFKGIVLKGLTIFENTSEGEINKKFLTVEEIYFRLPIPPLFARKLIITNLYIGSPDVVITRIKPKEWNFSDILTVKPPEPKPKFTTLISRAVISEGKISFKDLTKEPAFNTQMEATNGEMYLTLPANINFKFSSRIVRTPAITIQSSGKYNFLLQTLDLEFNTKDITLTDYAPYYQKSLPFEIIQGESDLKISFSLDKDKHIRLYGTSFIKGLAVQQESLQGSGDLTVTTDVAYKLGEEKHVEYRGDVEFRNFVAKGLPVVETLKNINGKVKFSKDTLFTDELKIVVSGTPVVIKGKINNFNNPLLDLTLNSNIDLSHFKESLPSQFKERFKEIGISGNALLSMSLSGTVMRLQLLGKANFTDASFKTTLLAGELKNINGSFQLENDSLSTSNLTFYYKNTPFKLVASLINFSKPDIKLNLSSQNLTFEGKINPKDKISPKDKDIYLAKVQGKYLDSSFDLSGNITELKKPLVNIQGIVEFNLADLTKALPSQYSQEISNLSPEGRLRLNGEATGIWNQWENWSGAIQASSEQIKIKKIKFDRLLLDAKMENKKVWLIRLTANSYGGILNSTGWLELQHPQSHYRLDIDLLNFDFAELGKEPHLNWKYSSGYMSGKVSLEGYTEKSETITGRGWLKVGEGKFWETPLFAGLANILYFPNLGKVLFKRGSATFTVIEKEIRTSDLLLEGAGLDLNAKGSISFDGNLDFGITTELARGLAKQSPEFAKIANMIVSGLWNYVIELRLKGTVKKPKYSIVPKLPIKGLIEK